MKKIGVFTSGGDSPGMNACIRSVVRTGLYNNLEVVGIFDGFKGMIEGGNNFMKLDSKFVGNIIQRGGTVLKSSRCMEFMTPEGRKKAFENLKLHQIDGIVCIGGNGTFTGAEIFYNEYGIPSIGAPGTIDNDLFGTSMTIGFDTAINTTLDAIDRIRDTAASHRRAFFIEVMGRDSGFLALSSGIAGGAEMVLVPEVKENYKEIIEFYTKRENSKRTFSICVVAEGNHEGNAVDLTNRLKKDIVGFDPRVVILGHIQRGGSPSAFDRILASRFGNSAVEALIAGEKNKMVGLKGKNIELTSYFDAINKRKRLNPGMVKLIEILNF